jgi:hypothetical protein
MSVLFFINFKIKPLWIFRNIGLFSVFSFIFSSLQTIIIAS